MEERQIEEKEEWGGGGGEEGRRGIKEGGRKEIEREETGVCKSRLQDRRWREGGGGREEGEGGGGGGGRECDTKGVGRAGHL